MCPPWRTNGLTNIHYTILQLWITAYFIFFININWHTNSTYCSFMQHTVSVKLKGVILLFILSRLFHVWILHLVSAKYSTLFNLQPYGANMKRRWVRVQNQKNKLHKAIKNYTCSLTVFWETSIYLYPPIYFLGWEHFLWHTVTEK